MDNKREKKLKRIYSSLKKATTAEEFKRIHSDIQGLIEEESENRKSCRGNHSRKISLDICAQLCTAKDYLAYGFDTKINKGLNQEDIKENIVFALSAIKKALNIRPNPSIIFYEKAMEFLRLSKWVVFGIVLAFAPLLANLLIHCKFFKIGGWMTCLTSTIDWQGDAYWSWFAAIFTDIIIIGITILLYSFACLGTERWMYDDDIKCSDLFHNTYGIIKITMLLLSLYYVFFKFDGVIGEYVVHGPLPLSFFTWILIGMIFEFPIIIWNVCYVYFSILKTKLGQIVFKPLNVVIYPVNAIFDAISLSLFPGRSMRFAYYKKESHYESAGEAKRSETKKVQTKYWDIEKREETRTASATYDGRDLSVNYTSVSYAPVQKTKTSYVTKNYTQTGKYSSNYGECFSLSTGKTHNYSYSYFVGTGEKKYLN